MLVVSIVSKKGGVGKSTLAMLLASGALKKEEKVCLIDADVNRQIGEWKSIFEETDWGNVEKPAWPDKLRLHADLEDLDAIFETLEKAQGEDVDLAIIDTRPGSYEDTAQLALVSDVVLIPAEPEEASWRLVYGSFEWLVELEGRIEKGAAFPNVRAVVSNTPTKMLDAATREGGLSNLPAADKDVLAKILDTPTLDTMIPQSKILSRLLRHGPLPSAAEAYRNSRSGGLMVGNFEEMLAVAESLYDEVREIGYA